MLNLKVTLLATSLLLAGATANAQDNGQYGQDGRQYSPYQQGLRDGGRNGDYERGNYDQHHYDRDYNNNNNNNRDYNNNNRGDYNNQQPYHQGGIGPGKGAAIGAGGGALLGGLLGGGLKGALIGGGLGAGIGAIVGKEHQSSQRRNNGYYSPR